MLNMSKKEKKSNEPVKTDMGIYVALDLGSCEVRGIAAKKDDKGNLVALATATCASTGMKRGAIQNVEETKNAINHVLTDLENTIKVQANKGVTDMYETVNVRIENVYVALNGNSIRTVNNTVNRRLGGDFITDELLEEFDRENRSIPLQNGEEIIDIVPLQFLVNDDETSTPVGCSCEVISATYTIFLGNASLLSNLKKCIEEIGRNLAGYCTAPVAAANATISANEKELGVVALDFGYSTTNVSIFYRGKIHFAFVIPIGSDIITKDIAQLKITEREADLLKQKCLCNLDSTKPDLLIGLSNGKDASYRNICNVVERRIDHIFKYVNLCIKQSNLRVGPQLEKAVLLGNASQLGGLKAKTEAHTGLPAHHGNLLERYRHLLPNNQKPNSFHVAIGTLLTATQNCVFSTKATQRPVEKKSGFKDWASKMVTGLFDAELPENQKNN